MTAYEIIHPKKTEKYIYNPPKKIQQNNYFFPAFSFQLTTDQLLRWWTNWCWNWGLAMWHGREAQGWSWQVILLMVQNSGVYQLRLIVYPMIYKVWDTIPGGCCLGFLPTINSDTPLEFWKNPLGGPPGHLTAGWGLWGQCQWSVVGGIPEVQQATLFGVSWAWDAQFADDLEDFCFSPKKVQPPGGVWWWDFLEVNWVGYVGWLVLLLVDLMMKTWFFLLSRFFWRFILQHNSYLIFWTCAFVWFFCWAAWFLGGLLAKKVKLGDPVFRIFSVPPPALLQTFSW